MKSSLMFYRQFSRKGFFSVNIQILQSEVQTQVVFPLEPLIVSDESDLDIVWRHPFTQEEICL